MALERTEDVERGVGLIPALGEVMPEEADEGVRPVYEGVRAKLRVPFVNFVFRVLANYPDYLRFAWGKTEPHLLTTGFERAADELRARALIERVPDPPEEGWQGMGDIESMRAFTDTIHYVLPRLLMVVSAFDEGLGDESGGGEATPEPAIAPGVAEGAVGLPMVAPEEVTGDLSKLFEEIRQRHGHPGVASYYRAVGRWPRFLEAVWERVGPLVGSGPYERRKGELLQYARSAVLELPLPGREEATALGVDDESVGELRAILAVFRFRVIPDTFWRWRSSRPCSTVQKPPALPASASRPPDDAGRCRSAGRAPARILAFAERNLPERRIMLGPGSRTRIPLTRDRPQR